MSGGVAVSGSPAPSGGLALIPVRVAMDRIGVGRTTIYKLVGEGRLQLAHPPGIRKACITSTSLDAYVAEAAKGAAHP